MTAKSTDPSPLFPLPEDFLEDLETFFCTRLDRLDPVKESAEYAAMERAAQELAERIAAVMPENAAAFVNEFCDCNTNMAALAMEMGYRQGFVDGIRMIVLGCGPWPEEVRGKETDG